MRMLIWWPAFLNAYSDFGSNSIHVNKLIKFKCCTDFTVFSNKIEREQRHVRMSAPVYMGLWSLGYVIFQQAHGSTNLS